VNGALVADITSVTFQWDGRAGANEYIVEVADNPDFRSKLTLGPVIRFGTDATGGQTLANQDISKLRRTNRGNVLYWRVGARNRNDAAVGWAYSLPAMFTIPG
jgi:hypothetical protein